MDPVLSRVITIGTLACAVGVCGVCVAAFVIGIPSQFKYGFTISFWVVNIDIILFALLIALTSLSKNETLQQLFGFLQYKAGSGAALLFLGSLALGMAGTIGLVVGSITMAWGAISIVGHFATPRTSSAPRHEPLLPSSQ